MVPRSRIKDIQNKQKQDIYLMEIGKNILFVKS